MTPIDKKINQQVIRYGMVVLMNLAIMSGFVYLTIGTGILGRLLDGLAVVIFAFSAQLHFRKGLALFRTPGHIRYLAAIREEFGNPDVTVGPNV